MSQVDDHQNTSSQRDELLSSIVDSVEAALYGESAQVRDEGRSQVIRAGRAREVARLVNALSAPLAVTRRRATRLLSDLQPHRALAPIKEWIQRLARDAWSTVDLTRKPIREALISAARLMNQLTSRGEHEVDLLTLWSAPDLKVKRATICPASPPLLLAQALGERGALSELAAAESLRRLQSLDPNDAARRLALREMLTPLAQDLLVILDRDLHDAQTHDDHQADVDQGDADSVERAQDLLTTQPSLPVEVSAYDLLLGYLCPQDPRWSVRARALDPLGLRCCQDLEALADALRRAVHLPMSDLATSRLIESLIAIERVTSRRLLEDIGAPLSISAWSSHELLNTLVSHPMSSVRALIARMLPPQHDQLQELVRDVAPEVQWSAHRAAEGQMSYAQRHARLGAHDRLSLPSAQPPYGLRAFDRLPTIERVGGALALCQARFDVNLGVAMRSAEAAGLSEVFVIGARSGSLSSARGAEHALPIIWLTDPYELIIETRRRGYQLVAIQQTPDSQPYHRAHYPPRPLFVLGSEDAGLPDELRLAADLVVEIPLYGSIDSLNVSTAATCVIMHWRAHLS